MVLRNHQTALLLATIALAAITSTASAGEIHEAIVAGDVARVAAMLRGDATLAEQPDETDQFLSLPLHFAAMHNQRKIAQLLLDAGADVDGGDSDNSRPLDVAAMSGHADMVSFLLDNGADVNQQDNNGSCPVNFALTRGHTHIIRLLLRHGADLVAAGGERGIDGLLRRATNAGHVAVAELLLEHGADVRDTNEYDGSLLHGAGRSGHAEMVHFLIGRGLDVNARNHYGATPLLLAAQHGRTEAVAALLTAGARPDLAEDCAGRLPLHVAVIKGYRDVARALLQHGAALNATDSAGSTALDLAQRYGHTSLGAELRQRGGKAAQRPVDCGLLAQPTPHHGEALIWFLYHSGWVIKTRNHLLVFDYFEREEGRPDEPSLCNGWVDPKELAGEKVAVFATHIHADHYDPVIFEWADDIRDCTYFLGCQPPDVAGYVYTPPRTLRTVDGLTIRTIESNDTGVGYVIDVDGVTIYHAGDHANRQRDFSGPYKAEIDWLAAEGVRPDVAFMPISGCGFGDQVAVKMGVHYALETLKPKVFMPMHAGDSGNRYREFVDECRDRFPETRMEAQQNRGDFFQYRDGEIGLAMAR